MRAIPASPTLALVSLSSATAATVLGPRAERSPERRRAQSGEALAAALVADALVVRAEADLRWLDLCESRIAAGCPSRPYRERSS